MQVHGENHGGHRDTGVQVDGGTMEDTERHAGVQVHRGWEVPDRTERETRGFRCTGGTREDTERDKLNEFHTSIPFSVRPQHTRVPNGFGHRDWEEVPLRTKKEGKRVPSEHV